MSKQTLGSSLVLALGLGGCTTTEQTTPPIDEPDPDYAETHQAIAEDLTRLRELDVFVVGHIIRDLPAEATGCYFDDIGGLPCPGWEDEVVAADTKLRPRLHDLVTTSIAAAASSDPTFVMNEDRVAADLAALRALEIVEVGELITTVAQNNPNCYNLPCPEDEEAAREANRLRAAKLASITTAVKD